LTNRRESIPMVLNFCKNKNIEICIKIFFVSSFTATSEVGSKEEFRRTYGNECMINEFFEKCLFKFKLF